jgi:hypothetical protein
MLCSKPNARWSGWSTPLFVCFTLGKKPIPTEETGWATGPDWTVFGEEKIRWELRCSWSLRISHLYRGGSLKSHRKFLVSTGYHTLNLTASSQSKYRLCYTGTQFYVVVYIKLEECYIFFGYHRSKVWIASDVHKVEGRMSGKQSYKGNVTYKW